MSALYETPDQIRDKKVHSHVEINKCNGQMEEFLQVSAGA